MNSDLFQPFSVAGFMNMRLLCFLLFLLVFPANALAIEVINDKEGYSFALPDVWEKAPSSVVDDLQTRPDDTTRYVESFVTRDSDGFINTRLAVYVNRSGKFNAASLEGDMDAFARGDLKQKSAWATSKGRTVRNEYSFNDEKKSAILHYFMGDLELHKYYFFTTYGYVYVKLWGGGRDHIVRTRPFVARLALHEDMAFSGDSRIDWDGMLNWEKMKTVLISILIGLFVLYYWFRKVRLKLGIDEKDPELPSAEAFVFQRRKEALQKKRIAEGTAKQPTARVARERKKTPRRFGREAREAKMATSEYSVGSHVPKRKYLKAYK